MADNVAGQDRTLLRVAVILLPLALAPLGCRNYTDNTPRPAPPTARYPQAVANPLPTGRVHGRVTWNGERPVVPPVNGLIDTDDGAKWGDAPNPFAPRIGADGGVADVVVSLAPVDSTQLKPWPYPPLVIEHADGRLRTTQAGVTDHVGLVKLGDEVEMIARGKEFRLLRGRGAAYFTLTFPEPDRPRKRTLDTPGVVEITSATGDFWNAVDVVVCEHPYYAVTDEAGRFDLTHVPPGEYDLTARVRNWMLPGRERDPETGKIVRLTFPDPVRLTQRVSVPSDDAVRFEVNLGHFPKQKPPEK